MRRIVPGLILFVAVLAIAPPLDSAAPYEAAFTNETMRVDYLQTGGRGIDDVTNM